MAVLVTAEIQHQTQQGYDGMLEVLMQSLKQAPGLIFHTGHAVEGGWRVLEAWNSKADANQFYAQHVAPKLPPGIRPKRTLIELHSVIQP